jgi:hypothetical protein
MTDNRTAYCSTNGLIFMGKRRSTRSFFLARAPWEQLQDAICKLAPVKEDGRSRYVPGVADATTYLQALELATEFSGRLKEELGLTGPRAILQRIMARKETRHGHP